MRILLLALLSASVAGYAGVKFAEGRHREVASGKFRSEERGGARTKRWSSGDLRTWAATARNPMDPLADEWADWSEDDLKEALEEGVMDPEIVNDLSDARRIAHSIFGEWMERNPDDATRWWEGLESERMRRSFSGILSMNWPEDRAADGLAYIIAHRSDFISRNSVSTGGILRLAINDAAKGGPDAVGALFARLREHELDPRYSRGWEFPEGFDFAKLMEHPETRSIKATFFSGIWMDRNPDEAFRYLIADRDVDDMHKRDLFNDVLPASDGEKLEKAMVRARWLSGRLAELPIEKQKAFVSGTLNFSSNPRVLGSFVAGLTDETLREQVVSDSVQSLARYSWDGRVEPVLEFIEAAGDEGWRLDALESLKIKDGRGNRFVNGDSEILLRKKLAEWNAPPDRVESIMTNLRAQ